MTSDDTLSRSLAAILAGNDRTERMVEVIRADTTVMRIDLAKHVGSDEVRHSEQDRRLGTLERDSKTDTDKRFDSQRAKATDAGAKLWQVVVLILTLLLGILGGGTAAQHLLR